MTVAAEFILPAQPPQGSFEVKPLGGDGRIYPILQYSGRCDVVGDASGGVARVNIGFDTSYTAMVASLMGRVVAGTGLGTIDVVLDVLEQGDDQIASHQVCTEITGIGTVTHLCLWKPPAKFVAPRIDANTGTPSSFQGRIVNPGAGVTFQLFFDVLMWRPEARQESPYGILQANQSR